MEIWSLFSKTIKLVRETDTSRTIIIWAGCSNRRMYKAQRTELCFSWIYLKHFSEDIYQYLAKPTTTNHNESLFLMIMIPWIGNPAFLLLVSSMKLSSSDSSVDATGWVSLICLPAMLSLSWGFNSPCHLVSPAKTSPDWRGGRNQLHVLV